MDDPRITSSDQGHLGGEHKRFTCGSESTIMCSSKGGEHKQKRAARMQKTQQAPRGERESINTNH